MRKPHALAAEHVVEELDGDLERGLSAAEASARLARLGPNRLPRARRPAFAAIALRQFADPLVGLLIGAVLVSLLIGERVEAAVIAAIVVSTGFSASYKRRAQRVRCSHFARFSNSARASCGTDESVRSASSGSFRAISWCFEKASGYPPTHEWWTRRGWPWTSRP